MSQLVIVVAIDGEATHRAWAADIARKLRAVAAEVAGAPEVEGAPAVIRIHVDWPDLEAWPEPWQPRSRPGPDMIP